MELTSTDPFAAPAIDPAYLQSEFDIFTMLEAVKAVRRFAEAQTFDGYIIEPFGEFGAATTDELLETFARGNAATVFHPVGTSSMSPKGANWGVVDPDLRVKGVEGLFIIDAGVIVSVANLCTEDVHLADAYVRRTNCRLLTPWLRPLLSQSVVLNS